MQYLRIENGSFGFIDDRLHEPNKNDILITENDYKRFFEMQSAGEQFRLKKPAHNAASLFDFIETFKSEDCKKKVTINALNTELFTLKKKIELLEQKISNYKEG